MGLLDDPGFQSKYQKSKRQVRLWESEFVKKNGCNPTKADIKLAPTHVRDAYKIYYKLKTLALEESLRESFSDDIENSLSFSVDSSSEAALPKTDCDLSKCSVKSVVSDEKPKVSRPALKDIQNENDDAEKKKSLSDDKISSAPDADLAFNTETVWGSHLNKSQNQSINGGQINCKSSFKRSSSFVLSEKLFSGSKFSKRNPRKSLSHRKSVANYKLNDSVMEDQENKEPFVMSAGNLDSTVGVNENNFSPGCIIKTPAIQNIEECKYKIVTGALAVNCQATNIINKALMESDSKKHLLLAERKLDKGWVERHTDYDSGVSNLSSQDGDNSSSSEDARILDLTNNSPLSESQEVSVSSVIQTYSQAICSDEDVVYNSESEDETGIKRKRKLISKRKFSLSITRSDGAEVSTTESRAVKKIRLDSDLLSSSSSEINGKSGVPPCVRNTDDSQPRGTEVCLGLNIRDHKGNFLENMTPKISDENVLRNVELSIKNKHSSDSNDVRKTKEISNSAESETADFSETPRSIRNVREIDIDAIASSIVARDKVPSQSKKVTKTCSKKEQFENKIASGKANENFVKINIKKKVFVRGKKTMNFAKYKKMEWKKKKKANGSNNDYSGSSLSTCFKCGDVGHFARNCNTSTGDKLLALDDIDPEDDSPFPTIDEAAAMAAEPEYRNSRRRIDVYNFTENVQISDGNPTGNLPPAVVEELNPFYNGGSCTVTPLYDLKKDGSVVDTPEEVYEALKLFGHETFRHGQEEAIMRILSGKSTLLMLATGSGKSLCYQLPAYLFAQRSKCITLVISPLVSLMEDQVMRISSCLQAACLHTNQTEKQREKVIDMVKSGKLQILLVSPEAVASCVTSKGFAGVLKLLPPIAFACIDEAHCVSQWSHNFRPSYLSICKVLREKLKVHTILGLTATATNSTCASIIKHLNIPDGEKGVIKDIPLPSNLVLTVSKDESKDKALIKLLTNTHFKECQSAIIYCTRRVECERLATLLRTFLQDPTKRESNAKRARVSWNAEAYHAGLTAFRRKTVQQAFMAGKLRIVVATVAFGMGINKKDIRAVIHYNMPKSFESYVQEVGRAGRDGQPAFCHLFLDSKGGDKRELRRHIHGDSVDRHTIRKLLQRVFIPCNCARLSKLLENINFEDASDFKDPAQDSKTEIGSHESYADQEAAEKQSVVKCPGHEVAFSVDETVRALDIPQENISTMLCYMELHPKSWIKVLSPVYTKCKLLSYKGANALKAAIRKSPPLAMAAALDQRRGISHANDNRLEFSVVEIAAALDWDSGMVKNHLKQLEWTKVNDKWRRTGMNVEFSELGFHVIAPGNLSATELDDALDSLYERVDRQEKTALQQLETIFEALSSVAYPSYSHMSDGQDLERSNKLKELIRSYFTEEFQITDSGVQSEEIPVIEDQVCADVRHLVCSYKDTTFTGRSVARIFHGIASPCFPANVWGRCKFWRAHLDVDFHLLCKLASREILRLR